ncbi:hypothetical protein B0T26DRAFT_715152 [Lasiosphaeria miniovina]|uniref:CorA-like transporter domain-containing protein n=1 Tax=Lasiosphaeria miniovina TaxID=1954250 RepID=A0AA40ABI2_9PEZI|nr:uncharacterized protein B0T26DRAFT_715152 [Lasiosphaeria miniovina]KAK0712749.1 hypothetical protein B0T26DRAFT_715152 [Lasiosphaeria miniovina]
MYTFMFNEQTGPGDRYPVDINCYAPIGEDLSLCDRKLSEESLKLFQISGGGIDVLRQNEALPQTQCQRSYLTSKEIEEHGILEHLRGDSWQHLIFVVRPTFSWSQLCITELAFRTLLSTLRVFTPFLQVVHAFGTKTNDKQRARDLAFCRVLSSAYEFCYNIRYFELNKRGRGNPWSLRQTGVYQKCLANRQSAWLLLDSSNYIADRILAAFGQQNRWIHESCKVSQLLPHLFIFSAATRNWDLYIENLRQKSMIFDEKAYSSRFNETYLDDYKLLFSDVQEIISLNETITLALTVIKGQRRAFSEYSNLHARSNKRKSGCHNCDIVSTLEMLKAKLQHHHEAMTILERATSRTTILLSAILQTRANDHLRATMATIRTDTTKIQGQLGQTCLDMSHLLQVSKQGHQDATKIKILGQVATLFLPASLIASLFSSTMFSDSNNSISYIALYFEITLPLVLATLFLLILLEKGLPKGTQVLPFFRDLIK